MSSKSLSGSCLCGDISFTSTSAPEHLDYCYCRTCQKMASAPFMAWMGIPKSSLEWKFKSKPTTLRTIIGDTGVFVSERTFCPKCSCNIMLQYDLYPEKTHIAAITIDHAALEIPPVGCHIWCKHVPKWHTIPDDGVERYEEFDDGFKAKLDKHIEQIRTSQSS